MDILLLHGAIGAASQMAELQHTLSKEYNVHTLDFTGHGGKKAVEEPFSIELFTNDVLRYIDSNKLDKVILFGYSMGGYIAMYLAKHYPNRIDRIITLATKYSWDEAIAAKEVKMLDPEKITAKLPAFAATLQERHAPLNWKVILNKTAEMMTAMSANSPLQIEDYPAIAHPSLIMLGDRDKMVTLEETFAVYKALPNAQLCVLPGTGHPIEQLNALLCANVVEDFLNG